MLDVNTFEEFFEMAGTDLVKGHRFFFFRKDGHTLFSNQDQGATPGALSTGAWQAAFSLIENIGVSEDIESNFRFSFDTSDKGIQIIPFKIQNEVFYGAVVYENEINPALIKNQFKRIVENLRNYIKENSSTTQKGSEYLFQDISDAEIDNLFSFASK